MPAFKHPSDNALIIEPTSFDKPLNATTPVDRTTKSKSFLF